MRAPRIERKTEYLPIVGQVKATNDSQGIVEGYLNYIGNIDHGDDRTMPGAFRKTLQDSYARKSTQRLNYLWPYLWNHDYSQIPPGGIFDADEDRKGLYTKTQLNLDLQSGRDLYSSFKMGSLKKQSMGYKAMNVDWVKEEGKSIRNLLEVAVMEGSAVVFPMNDLATVDTVKGRTGSMLTRQDKDFNDRYRMQQLDDWLYADWNDLTTALKQSIQDLFASGDSPMQDLENIVLNDSDNSQGFLTALRNYIAEGIALDYSNYLQEQSSANDAYPMMMSNARGFGQKSGYLSADAHTTIKEASQMIMTHAKKIQKVSNDLERARSQGLQGYPRTMSSSSSFESKEDIDAINAVIGTLATGLEVDSALREGRETLTDGMSPAASSVDAALQRLRNSLKR
jgi:HK97 family phage prohead protease